MNITLTDIENAIHDAKNREIALYNAAVDLVKKLRTVEGEQPWSNELAAMEVVLEELGHKETECCEAFEMDAEYSTTCARCGESQFDHAPF